MSIEILIYIAAFFGLFAVVFYFLGITGRKTEEELFLADKELPTVSIIIPAYNEEKGIAATIKSASELDYPKNKLKIIVIDDGSRDNTYKIAKKFESEIIMVYTKKNGGKGAALNLGISRAKSEIIVTMDADTFAEKSALKNMARYFKRKEVVCVTPVMTINNPHGIWTRIQQVEYFLGIFLRKAFASMNAIHITPGAFSAYRKIFFDKHGGFDEKNITEDLEIALRIQANNFRIENSLNSVIYTVAPETFNSLLKQRRRWYHGLIVNLWSYRRLFSKKYGDLGLIVLPIAVLTILFSMIITSYTFIKTVFNIGNELVMLRSINFNFINYFEFSKYFIEKIVFSMFSSTIFLISLMFIAILVAYMIFAKTKVKEHSAIKISLALFLIFYSVLFVFWWIVSIVYTLFRVEVKWGK